MGLVGITYMSWMIVRAAFTILTWVALLLWLTLRGVWFLAVTVPLRAYRKHRANTEYQQLINDLINEPPAGGSRRIDRPAA